MKNQTFYMVFLEGGNAPTARHAQLIGAQTEAKRLAKLTGKKAFVLCTLMSIEVNEFTISDMRPENSDLPF